MDIFDFFTLFGGLALFLYGMNLLGASLEKIAGGKLQRVLERMTNSPIKGVLLGAGVTAVIQSSSATTVMMVGFVNSGIMKLSQAIGVIMGANIGTTVTAWILATTGIKSNNFYVQLLKPDSFSPVLAVIGIILIMFFKDGKKKDIGGLLIGFAILMFGMSTMSGAVSQLAQNETFANVMTMFSNPVLGVLVGAGVTAIIQSSSASVGILQSLSSTGKLNFGAAIPIIMGQNIGTCVTALISCIGAKKNARRAAMVHLYFNIIGTIVFLVLFYGLNALIDFTFINDPVNETYIAIVHTTFNILTTLLLLPFSKGLEKLAKFTIRDKATDDDLPLIDERFLHTPSFAIEQCKNAAVKMAYLSKDAMIKAINSINAFDIKDSVQIEETEKKIDWYEDQLGTYLVKVSSKDLSEADSREISKLLHTVGDFERIGDHAVNIIRVAREINDKKICFSDDALTELCVLTNALTEILNITTEAFSESDIELAKKVEPLEQVIDGLKAEIKKRHISRLQDGVCTIEMGFILSDLLNNYERVSDHCSNIAVCLIQIKDSVFDTHGYLNEIKTSGESYFIENYNGYKDKYLLPRNIIDNTGK